MGVLSYVIISQNTLFSCGTIFSNIYFLLQKCLNRNYIQQFSMVSQKGSISEGMMTQVDYKLITLVSNIILYKLKGGFLK